LRREGVAAVGDYEGRSLKRQLEQASKLGCSYAALLGDDELARQEPVVTLRDMRERAQMQVPWAQAVRELQRRLAISARSAA